MEQKELVDLIVSYRVRNNMSMKKFANYVGVSHITMHNIETGKHKPQRVVVRKILNVIENEVV